jgi:ribosomal protein L11 methylase PrmA
LLWQLNTTGIATVDEPLGPQGADPAGATPDSQARSRLLAGFDTLGAAQAAHEALIRADIGGTGGWRVVSVEPVDEEAWVDDGLLATIEVAGVELTIEVGSAFGHGRHPSTSLILGLLGLIDPSPISVLDFGCGTGVLTLAALAAGAGTVHAVDIDPAALAITGRNLERNRHLVDTGRVGLGTDLEPGPVSFDAILANVLLPVHGQWGARLTSMLAPGGVIVVSGVLEEQRESVLAAYPGLAVGQEQREGDWLGLVLSDGGLKGTPP